MSLQIIRRPALALLRNVTSATTARPATTNAAAALKLPELLGPEGNGIRGQAIVAALAAALAAYVSVRFLMRYFETRTLIPFAIWSLLFGLACSIYFAVT